MGLLNKSKAEGSLILEEIMTGIPMMELVGESSMDIGWLSRCLWK